MITVLGLWGALPPWQELLSLTNLTFGWTCLILTQDFLVSISGQLSQGGPM